MDCNRCEHRSRKHIIFNRFTLGAGRTENDQLGTGNDRGLYRHGCTVVLTIMMLIKGFLGLVTELEPVGMISGMIGAPEIVGWIGHFVIGTIAWGGGFAILHSYIPPSNAIIKGIVFGVGAWLIMMVIMMPLAGAGLFGINLGIGALAAALASMLHVVFGAVLGLVYSKEITGK
ncbi:DUF6789 family protein [Sulfitobacter sp.]|uniref:DUF6789 family protein n=1 Tax=Sulfitobacter sp. TaxID=1903071 RepID=UPI0030020102